MASGPAGNDKQLETSVMNKVLGLDNHGVSWDCAKFSLAPEENIDPSLLTSDEEEEQQPEAPIIETCVNVAALQKKPKSQKWGPVVATRVSSRIQKDGRTAVEKAQALQKMKNLEVPKSKNYIHGIKNSFAALDNAALMHNARNAGIVLGDSDENVNDNIESMKRIEMDRLKKFNADHPDMFLPSDIDITAEDIVCLENSHRNASEHVSCSHLSEKHQVVTPWIEVSNKKNKKRVTAAQNSFLEADFSEQEIKDAVFSSYAEVHVEKDGRFALPVGGVDPRGSKRKLEQHTGRARASSSKSTVAALAGSWLTLEKLTGSTLELAQVSRLEDADEALAWKVSTEGLAKRLEEESIKLVDDGLMLRVLD
ncbi:hypothetical protein ACQ4PT_012447 [Festuca glaucescens]